MKAFIRIIMAIISLLILTVLIGYLFLMFYPSVGKTPNKKLQESYKQKIKSYDGKFHNINEVNLMTGNYKKNKNSKLKPDKEIDVIKWDNYPLALKNEFTINWLGHSSSLIQLNGLNILIDPVFSKYASPVSFAGPKRFTDLAIDASSVPKIDVLLISHDHYDHLDYNTIKSLDDKVENYIVPLGVESYLYSWKIDKNKIHTLYWWDDITIKDVTFTSVFSQHYSGRNPLKKDSTLWCGYYFTNGQNSLYYTGDSGYMDDFKDISSQLGDVDVLLADSGQYNDAWSKIHMNPKETLQLAKDINEKYLIPVHWGAFALSNHNWSDPAKITTENALAYGVNVLIPKIGERINYEQIDKEYDNWWE